MHLTISRQSLVMAVPMILALSLGACRSNKFDGPEMLGGKLVARDTLNLGYDTYNQYCMQCHGISGDGMGTAAYGSNPPPRNFKQGLYKFGNVLSGDLPRDEDLSHTIRYGLRGTPMLPWDISDERLNAVVQYIKTFSPRWKTEKAGDALEVTPDPFGESRRADAILLGKKVYHSVAQCFSCHPSYAGQGEIDQWGLELTGSPVGEVRADAHLSINQDSSYGHKFMPPDFTKNQIKTGGSVASLYWVFGAGIGGTSMPSWKASLSSAADETERKKQNEERLWALAYYVNSLHELKFDLVARKAFFEQLNAKRQTRSAKNDK
jgi:mono/diheme cytochrome c family protein